MIHLISGGARSGKSNYAEQTVSRFGENICYIATAVAFDSGMKNRIAKHRAQRPDAWQTIEAYTDLEQIIRQNVGRFDAYLLDCVTIMVSNLLLDAKLDFDTASEAAIDALEEGVKAEMVGLIDAIRESGDNIVLVTNEIGCGIVPANRMARYFRDIAGRVNQYVASQADRLTLVVCGYPVQVKP